MIKLNTIATVLLILPQLFAGFPKIGEEKLNVISPNLIELTITSGGEYTFPDTSKLSVISDEQPISIVSVGVKRRAVYAPLKNYNLMVDTKIYLSLSQEISNTVKVYDSSGKSYSVEKQDTRFSPIIHVNQEGYATGLPKKAMVGYYLGI